MICDGKQDCANGADEKAYCHEICPEDQRKCKNGNICLSDNMICDGDAHCPDGEDEKGCSECKNGAKLCKPLSTCIPKWKLCDGNLDCPDASDELGCDCKTCSGNSKALCDGEVKMCLDKSRICDGKRDCPGGEDEEDCPGSCQINAEKSSRTWNGGALRWLLQRMQSTDLIRLSSQFVYKCVSSLTKCVHRSKLCDGKNDCGNNADEEDCGCNKPGMIKCASQTFAGRDSCYSKDQKCDGYNDCPGGEDELNCAECNRGSFLCSDDEKCILITKRCDGIDDCLDGSDEKDCSCQECMLHPFKTYMCSSGSRCFRLNNVCAPYSQCPNADDRDKLYCAVSQGGGRSYL
uniref:Uncharacterized protein n=1 Tax=Ditylenchus dipsaci TaxID=166011 RepID=A0A915DVS8_9BILA